MIRQWLREKLEVILRESYFSPTLPDDVKELSQVAYGRNVVWYGDEDQMIMLLPDEVYGMWGNIYNPEKMDELVDMILNYPEPIEIECSYGLGHLIHLVGIHEEQTSYHNGSFQTDYDGKDNPASTGDKELDIYIGIEYLNDIFDTQNDKLIIFFNKNRMSVANNYKTPQQLMNEFKQLPIDDESDVEAMSEFIDYEVNLKHAQDTNQGDFNKFMVQLRDGHHRVMAAIKAGEPKVFVNLSKGDIEKYKGYYRKV